MFKPLLAATLDNPDKLRFPLIASPKLDGIRCILHEGVPVSRKLKPIPNKHIRSLLSGLPLPFDGELMLANGGDFNAVQSAVMSEGGEPDFVYKVFDIVNKAPYDQRLSVLSRCRLPDFIKVLDYQLIENYEALVMYEELCIAQGYEGVMLRTPFGYYKYGRSTENEGVLVKMKRFFDAEAVVIGMVEKLHNTNEKSTNALGHSERSSTKAGLVGTNTLGALQCKFGEVLFDIGTGFNDAQRAEIWSAGAGAIGKTVTFKYQELSKYGVPRFPVFKAFREDI